MTDLRTAAMMALDAFDNSNHMVRHANSRVIEAIRAALTQEDNADISYEVWQDDEWQAGSNSKEETMRYAMQYAEDGPVEVYEVTRRVICKIEK